MTHFQLYMDPLVTCPYNPAHRLKRSRMQIHLTKCKKTNLELEMKVCPFNAQHRVVPSEFQYHITNCPDRHLVERQVVYESDTHQGCVAVPVYNVDRDPGEESWDISPNPVAGYDPRRKVDASSNTFKNYTGIQKTPAERREFYKTLFTKVGENPPYDQKESVSSPPFSEAKPLRKPKTAAEVLPVMNGAAGVSSRGGAIPKRTKIAASIFGASAPKEQDPTEVLQAPVGIGRGRGLVAGLGLGRGRTTETYGQYPPLAPGEVKLF